MSISTHDAATRDTPILRQRKGVGSVEVKLTGDEGAFQATFATFNAVDLDNDVTIPGAFTNGEQVRIAQWGHNWGALPVGKGVIHSDTQRAWVEGQFNLKTAIGRDTYETVKDLGGLQEWSYGFDILEWSIGQFGEPPKDVRFLNRLKVHEVSPVMLGAGIDTGTDAIKSARLGTDLPFAEHLELVTAQVKALVERAEDRAGIRAKEGRVLSAATITRLGEHPDTLRTIAKAIEDLIVEAQPKPKAGQADARKAYADALLAETAMYLTIAQHR